MPFETAISSTGPPPPGSFGKYTLKCLVHTTPSPACLHGAYVWTARVLERTCGTKHRMWLNVTLAVRGVSDVARVRHRSVVIVPPEGGLEFGLDSEMCWCFIHVTIKLVSGTTRRSVIESGITHVSSSPRETVVHEICFLLDLDGRKKMRRVCSWTLAASSFLLLHITHSLFCVLTWFPLFTPVILHSTTPHTKRGVRPTTGWTCS